MSDDLYAKRLLSLGAAYSDMMAEASIEKCNCMVRYQDGQQMPAIKQGRAFFDPEGNAIVPPTSHEMMDHNSIKRLLASNNTQYIGHMFGPFKAEDGGG